MNKEETLLSHPVLIVDDEQDICFMLSRILQQKAYNSVSVHSLSEANSWLAAERPALIFLDNNLPDGRGVDFLPILKKMMPGAKIIMITAYDSPTDRKLALEKGADEFIGKPFTRQTIYAAVDRLLN
ncbi:MAG: response regulator [Bacteroidota bacterium]